MFFAQLFTKIEFARVASILALLALVGVIALKLVDIGSDNARRQILLEIAQEVEASRAKTQAEVQKGRESISRLSDDDLRDRISEWVRDPD